MRVLHFLPWHSPKTKGGTETFLLNLALLQKGRGDEVHVIAPNCSDSAGHELVEGLDVHYFPSPYSRSVNQSRESFLGMVGEIAPDVIHIHGLNHFLVKFFEPVVEEMRIRLALTIHLVNVVCPNQTLIDDQGAFCTKPVAFETCSRCISAGRSRGGLRSRVDSLTISANVYLERTVGFTRGINAIPYQRSTLEQLQLIEFLRANCRIDVLSPWFYEVMLRNGFSRERMGLYPNPLRDAANFLPRADTESREGPLEFLFVGRVSKEKGIPLLVAAVRELEDVQDKFRITILGRNDDPCLAAELASLELEGFAVEVPGEASAPEVRSQFARSDYLVFPSLAAEMAPLVVQEALLSELPVITADTPAASAFVIDGLNGVHFAHEDHRDLARVLRHLIEGSVRLKFNFLTTIDVAAERYSYYRRLYSE